MANDPPPPDRPTQRLQPSPPPRREEERVVSSGVDLEGALLRLEDAIGSLRTGIMIVGVVAVAALGVAIYALVTQDDSGGVPRDGLASDSRVSELDDRVDRISRQVQDLRSGGDGEGEGEGQEQRIEALEKSVQELADRPSADPQEAIDELSSRIDDIAQDVERLQQEQPTP